MVAKEQAAGGEEERKGGLLEKRPYEEVPPRVDVHVLEIMVPCTSYALVFLTVLMSYVR
jgi:hypothetical protein